MTISDYLDQVRGLWQTGQATEHSYRPFLHALFQSIDPNLTVINEARRVEAGAPDFIFNRKGVAIGWCEAKDIEKDVIQLKGYSVEQRKRYERAFPNLLYTNGVDFEFIRDGQRVNLISIADLVPGLPARTDQFDELQRNLESFVSQTPISIKSAKKLAGMMAGKAAMIKDVLGKVLKQDTELATNLAGQYKSFKANLLPNLTTDEFADIYAETVTYGMFAARLHDTSLDTFSRAEAQELLPKSNPFLRSLFNYIAGPDLDDRIRWIVDDLAEVLRASDPHSLFEDFGKFSARNDPFVHFYETFLAEYNPKKRKSRGVWYTPEPVVDFIVRAVDDVLKTEFGLADGLADTSKVTVDWDTGHSDKKGKPVKVSKQMHRVQILDPATGTGTFLAKTVQTIAERVKTRAPGKWSGYVEDELIPRLHGFELLMASYAMCHMKLDMMLHETGYKPSKNPPRLSVWLTNALEPAEREVRDLFFTPLADEARGAGDVKRQTPIMCIIGNPPYSGESANKGDFIMQLMDAYKKEPGGKEKLNERNPKWINDDYVKFIRMSEHLIAQNPSGGVLGFITNHGYLDNPTFRGMRWHLLKTFDKIWVLDLHGNAKKKEVSPDGSPDKNVFDIQQGVALIIAVRKGAGSEDLAEVWHGDLWGSRKAKNSFLEEGVLSTQTQALDTKAPKFPLVSRDFDLLYRYEKGFSLADLQPLLSNGIVTARDNLTIAETRDAMSFRLEQFRALKAEEARTKFSLGKDVRDWRVDWAQEDVTPHVDACLRQINYRPFEESWTYYTGNSRGFHCYPRHEVMRHYLHGNNLGLLVTKSVRNPKYAHIFVTTRPSEAIFLSGATATNAMNVPLYLYPDETTNQTQALGPILRSLNVEPKLYAKICKAANIDPSNQAQPNDDFRAASGEARPSEVKVFDYIYGVLHSPDYRETYAEFLKIDFPHIPYPPSPEVFRHVSEKGEALRRLHLMEPQAIGDTPYSFESKTEGEGDDVVVARYPKFDQGKVYINPDQYFNHVPEVAWNFYIGGYQPAQKWLKDRKGRTLSYDDIRHYQSIIKILLETDRIMQEIELPLDAVELDSE